MSSMKPPKAVKAPKLTKQQIADLCLSIVAMGRDEGATPRIIGRRIDMSSAEIDALRKENDAFEAAWTKATEFALSYHEELIVKNLENKNFNAALSNQLLRANYPKTYEGSAYKVAQEKTQAASTTGQMSHEEYQREVAQLLKDLASSG